VLKCIPRSLAAKAVTETSPDPLSSASPLQQPVFRPLSWLGSLFWRALLLGLGGGVAAATGIAIALNQPPTVLEKPLFLTAWETWRSPENAAPPVVSSPSPSPSPPPGTVTREQRAQLEQQVASLRQQLSSVVESTAALEEEFDLEAGEQSLDERLEAVRKRVRTLPSAPEPPPPEPPPLASNAELQLGRKLRAPYDLDSIFAKDNSISEQGERQLFHLVQELSQYPGATVRIGVHLDTGEDAEQRRQLSLALAQVLVQYLRAALPNSDRYTWIPIGFGASRPLVPNNSEANRQRNRRVEIGLD